MRTLQIFSDIYEGTLYAISEMADNLKDGEDCTIEIASHGGLVFMGNASFQKIQEAQARGCKFTAKVYGIAASSAADIVLACNRIEMADHSAIMIHSAWNDAGNEDEGIAIANVAQLSVIHKRLPDYTEKDLKADRWFTAKEALEIGLCDAVFNTAPDSIQARLCAKYLGGKEMPEDTKVEPVKAEEVVEEKKEEMVEEKKEDAPSVEDILERIGERLDDLEGRLKALEGAKAECGGEPDRRDNARMRAVYERISAVMKPATPREEIIAVAKPDPVKELEAYKAKYPDLASYIRDDQSL